MLTLVRFLLESANAEIMVTMQCRNETKIVITSEEVTHDNGA